MCNLNILILAEIQYQRWPTHLVRRQYDVTPAYLRQCQQSHESTTTPACRRRGRGTQGRPEALGPDGERPRGMLIKAPLVFVCLFVFVCMLYFQTRSFKSFTNHFLHKVPDIKKTQKKTDDKNKSYK